MIIITQRLQVELRVLQVPKCAIFQCLLQGHQKEGGQEFEQSPAGIVWCNVRYAMCRKMVQEARLTCSCEQERQEVVHVPRDIIRMRGMKYHKWQSR